MQQIINGKKLNYREGVCDDYVIKDLMVHNTYNKVINFSKEDIWLDGGANIGIFAIDNFDKVKQIICFEPEEENCKLIKLNILSNNINNVLLEQKAVTDSLEKQTKFYLGKTPMSYSESFTGKPIRGRVEIIVNQENINDIIEKYNINCLKLDIEGGEYKVIKAISQDNWNKINKIFCEYHFNILRDIKTKEKYNEVIKILSENFSNSNYKKDTKGAWHTNIYFSK